MGYVSCMEACFGCKRLFAFNPNKVPSVRVDGVRRPICQVCVDKANPRRIANGLPPIVPMEGAYEAMPEEELR